MFQKFLRVKIHRATVTSADRDYEGSVSIDRALCRTAGLSEYEQVDIYDITNGARVTTYVIYGEPGQIQINGAAANLVRPADLVIIAAYAALEPAEIRKHKATVVLVDSHNKATSVKTSGVEPP